jgi:hypothetical protein
MKRTYNKEPQSSVRFFVGTEIEKTPAFGMRTLFVVGLQPVGEIMHHAQTHQCSHIYLGANQSFQPPQWAFGDGLQWRNMVEQVVLQGRMCTLDLNCEHVEWLQKLDVNQHPNFIPMISVKLPNINLLNPNTTLKLDDLGFDQTNPGVWCTSLGEIIKHSHLTSWHEYSKDQPIDQ